MHKTCTLPSREQNNMRCHVIRPFELDEHGQHGQMLHQAIQTEIYTICICNIATYFMYILVETRQ